MTTTTKLNESQITELSSIYRNQEIVQGMVQSVGFLNMPVEKNGEYVAEETEVAVFRLQGNITAYCPANEFAEHSYKTLNGFVGTIQNLIIKRLDLENSIAVVSVKAADKLKRERFWETIKYLDKKEALEGEVFEGVVYGINPKTQTVFVRVEGQNCFMKTRDWDYNRYFDASKVERGTKINVKVIRFNEEEDIVQVSRRVTMEDPFVKLETMKEMEVVVGRVANVDPINGIFVTLDSGVTLKGTKPRTLEEPLVGEIVQCRIREINAKERKGKVVITGYPNGKKKRQDLGDFLFE